MNRVCIFLLDICWHCAIMSARLVLRAKRSTPHRRQPERGTGETPCRSAREAWKQGVRGDFEMVKGITEKEE